MPLTQSLRTFISERLTAAAEEIFTEVEKAIIQYEEVVDRQRRLLDITWKPEIRLTRIDLPQQHVVLEKEVQTDQQQRRTSLDQEEPELLQIKVEPDEPEPLRVEDKQKELCSSRELLNQELYNLLVMNSGKESSCAEPEPNLDQLLPHSSTVTERRDQEEGEQVDSHMETPPMRHHSYGDASQTPLNTNVLGTSLKYKNKDPKYQRNAVEHFCPRCGKSFRKVDNMLLHLKTHSGDYVFTCIVCGRGFVYRSGLANHMKTHVGNKPHSCESCRKGFTSRVALMMHMRTHRGFRMDPSKFW